MDGVTGTFFEEQTVEALVDAVDRCDALDFDPGVAVAHAAAFGQDRFKAEMGAFIDAAIARARGSLRPKIVRDGRPEPLRIPG